MRFGTFRLEHLSCPSVAEAAELGNVRKRPLRNGPASGGARKRAQTAAWGRDRQAPEVPKCRSLSLAVLREVPDAVGELAQRLKSPKRLAALEPAVPKATETRASPAEHQRVFEVSMIF